jgi:hypothetical protein
VVVTDSLSRKEIIVEIKKKKGGLPDEEIGRLIR